MFLEFGMKPKMDNPTSLSTINGLITFSHIAEATRSRVELKRGIDAFIETSWTN